MTVAVASVTVGVKVMALTLFGTEVVYVVVPLANTGLIVPLLNTRFASVATVDGAPRVTVIV